MTSESRLKSFHDHLFADQRLNVYAVLDGASIDDLLVKLQEHNPEHCCLFSGALPPDLAQSAPYLVKLEPDALFTSYVLSKGLGKHWGIFAVSPAEMIPIRRHFRSLMLVRGVNGRHVYFRYYDPRVLNVYLPTCDGDEVFHFFGPVQSYFSETAGATSVYRFTVRHGRITRTRLRFANPAILTC